MAQANAASPPLPAGGDGQQHDTAALALLTPAGELCLTPSLQSGQSMATDSVAVYSLYMHLTGRKFVWCVFRTPGWML